jgi:valyl-tRNA synthetase
MGCELRLGRTRFTLDPVCARAVRETFFRMFRDGYIFRGKRLVNWDTHLQTSVADDETYTEDTKSGFWTFKYPVDGMPDDVHPLQHHAPRDDARRHRRLRPPPDERYKHLIGKQVTIPLTGREIPIIADGQLADPELGTGCVKVTPAHDPNDYACWQRHPEIGIINILNPDGTINENGGKFAGPGPLQGPRGRDQGDGGTRPLRGQGRPRDPAEVTATAARRRSSRTCRTSGS